MARRSADLVGRTVAADPDAALILPAGRTPVPLYAELVRRSAAGELDLSRAHVFQLDELVGVGADDPRSFHAFLRRHLLDRVPREPGRDHLLGGAAADPERELREHVAALEERGGARLALLGLGRNGHVAFNEPGSTLDDAARLVDLTAETRAALADAFDGAPPGAGMTLGLRELVRSRALALIVTGDSKRAILETLLEREPSSELPASLLPRDRLRILADAAAAP